MAARRLRWQGPARTESCRLRLREHLEAWRLAWCVGGETDPVVEAPAAGQAGRAWRGAGRNGAAFWLGAPTGEGEALGASLAGLGAPDRAGLAAALAGRALDDLLARLLDSPLDAIVPLADPAADAVAERFGGLAFSFSGVLSGYRLLVDVGACDLLAPPVFRPVGGLVSRLNALRAQPLSLDVAMPLGEHALARSIALEVGDVLLAGPLGAPTVRLTTGAGQAVASGALVRAGDARGVRIEQRLENRGVAQ